MNSWYQLKADEIYRHFKSSESGLAKKQISALRKEYGENVLKEAKQKSKFSILLSQFKDVMIMILIIAAAVSFFVGEHTDAYVILAIIIGNAWIGYSQENNAEESVRMLQKMSAQYSTVLRDKSPSKVEASELVPGDVILLEAGDIVPADARVIQASSFKTEEAALTGESHSIEKVIEPMQEAELGPGDQHNMVFKGTMVSNGSAKAIVTETGMNTEIGKIAGLLNIESQKTPLQKRLAKFSKQLAGIVILICVIVFVSGLLRGQPPFLMFLTALSLAVAALPEALPAVVTIALSKGAQRMVKQKALMRNLPSVETLGSVTYICSDKTGTLTQNVMTVEKMQEADGKHELLMHAMMLNNEVRFSDNGDILGDSTETSLVNYSIENGLTKNAAEEKYHLVEKVPFDSVRMRMSTFHQHQDKWILLVKGAPIKVVEVLAAKYKEQEKQWLDTNHDWAADGLRVLFFAYRVFDEKPSEINESLEADLDFLGMVAMIDPPREEVIEAMKECRDAGIKTVMITGDQSLTANAIAERLNMGNSGSLETLTGAELAKLNEADFSSAVENISVYARVSPEQKLNIVKALQENGEFVAMTGDGVNDAPSLKQSDIGVAMGITGTDVSKEAADMILLDDNFATIVRAVKEGRRIYENIRKFIQYILSSNLAEILTIFFAPIVGLAIPLLPIHILWINLVTDGLPGLALTAEPAEEGIMNRPPRPPKESLFAGGMIFRILSIGVIMAVAVLLCQDWAQKQGYDIRTQQTMVFTILCFTQLGNALSVRFAYHSMFKHGLFSNIGMWITILITISLQLMIVYVPFLQVIFKTSSLDWNIMQVVVWVTALCILGFELAKLISNKIYFKQASVK